MPEKVAFSLGKFGNGFDHLDGGKPLKRLKRG
jgi:hypothetical protein